MSTHHDLQLADGRRINVELIQICDAASDAGVLYSASTEAVWNCVVGNAGKKLPGHWAQLPTFVVPPVSVRRDELVAPRWKVHAILYSNALEPEKVMFGGSYLVLVFFCDDIASQPITELIQWQLASVDEQTWRTHAEDWEP